MNQVFKLFTQVVKVHKFFKNFITELKEEINKVLNSFIKVWPIVVMWMRQLMAQLDMTLLACTG